MAHYRYQFAFADGHSASFAVDTTAGASSESAAPPPDWTRLDFHQCPHCPLSVEEVSHCPLALRLVPLVALGAQLHSYDEVSVQVESAQRTVSKATTVQSAFGSLYGLLSALSGCPRTAFLQPMAHFHLPFADASDTLYRVVSGYLLAQYFRRQQGLDSDWELADLQRHYDELQGVNTAMVKRLKAISDRDGVINAIIKLDAFAKLLQFSVDESVQELQPLFAAYGIKTERD